MSESPRSNPAPRILMVGYYGHGNFGDDVLMLTTYRLLREAMPHAIISVIIGGNGGAYVQRMLGGVTLLPPGRHGHFDFIIHGGGGVFFDFAHYTFWQQWFETLIRYFGWNHYLRFEKWVRRMVGKPRTSADCQLGLGIGIGSFSRGSALLRKKISVLADFSALWLRDGESKKQLAPFESAMRAELIHGSDLAFLTSRWLADLPKKPANSDKPRLGIILRDWPINRGGITPAILQETLAQLTRDYSLTVFIFDANADPKLQQTLSAYTTHIWQPEATTIDAFAANIAAQDVLLTSRAHGAICGACLGVPSAIVAIEPKLEQVHTMLQNASVMVAPNAPEQWATAIANALRIPPSIVTLDVSQNRTASENALRSIKRWLR